MIKIGHGAEAIVYKDNNQVIKERFTKKYRLPQIDESLRKFRTRREAKVLGKLHEMKFPAPQLLNFCDKRMSLTMDFVPGEQLKDVLEKGDDYQQLATEIGNKVGRMHAKDIVHGDLTTSNMILDSEIKFIDFGLSSFTDKIEDKAVDLFLLDRTLESKHYLHYPQIFDKVIEGYRESNPEAVKVLERFSAVKKRGRNKNK